MHDQPLRSRLSVRVLGAGIAGLTCAVRLQRDGHDVVIRTRELPAATTSAVAAAIWYPYEAGPEESVRRWATNTYDAFADLADQPGTSVSFVEALSIWPEPMPLPWWDGLVRGFREARPEELPEGYACGWVYDTVLAEMPAYLLWLQEGFEREGGRIEHLSVTDLAAATAGVDVVVNCTGLGARELCDDRSMQAIRGQVVKVRRSAGFTRCVLDDHGPRGLAYMIPRSIDVVLGGTAEPGKEDITPDPETTAAIFARCASLEPRLGGAKILAAQVGLRPGRPVVRLEAEQVGGTLVVHNYGHGGSGMTLAWGCADEVADLVGQGLASRPGRGENPTET